MTWWRDLSFPRKGVMAVTVLVSAAMVVLAWMLSWGAALAACIIMTSGTAGSRIVRASLGRRGR